MKRRYLCPAFWVLYTFACLLGVVYYATSIGAWLCFTAAGMLAASNAHHTWPRDED